MVNTAKKNTMVLRFSVLLIVTFLAFILGALVPIFLPIFEARYYAFLAIPAAILIFTVFILSPEFTFWLILLTRPSLDLLLDTTKIGAFGLGAVLNLVIILIAAIQLVKVKEGVSSVFQRAWLPFIIICTISLFYAPDVVIAIKTYLAMLSYAAMFVIALTLIRSHEDLEKWLKVVVFSAIGPALYAFVNILNGGYISGNTASEGFRINSTFAHPNVFAFYLVLVITLFFLEYKLNNSSILKPIKSFLPIILILLLGLLFLTKTRSAWGACFVLFFAYALLYERKYFIYIGVAFIVAVFIPEIRERLVDLTQGNEVVNYSKLNSYAWRKKIWGDALAWMEPIRYIYGYGLDGFRHFSPVFFSMSGGRSYGAHNVYVQLIFDVGIVGLVSYLWLHFLVIKKSLNYYSTNKYFVFLCSILVIEYILEAYSDNMMGYLAFNWYLWFLIGACFATYRLPLRENNAK